MSMELFLQGLAKCEMIVMKRGNVSYDLLKLKN